MNRQQKQKSPYSQKGVSNGKIKVVLNGLDMSSDRKVITQLLPKLIRVHSKDNRMALYSKVFKTICQHLLIEVAKTIVNWLIS